MVSTCPLLFKSSNPFTNPLGIVPSAPTTIVITVTFMLHSFFSSLARSSYSSLFSPLNFTQWSVGTAESTIQHVLLFLLTIIRSGYLAEIMWSVYISKFQRTLFFSFSRTDSKLCIYHLFVCSNFNLFSTIPSGWLFHSLIIIIFIIIIIPCELVTPTELMVFHWSLWQLYIHLRCNCWPSMRSECQVILFEYSQLLWYPFVLLFSFPLQVSSAYPCPAYFIWNYLSFFLWCFIFC